MKQITLRCAAALTTLLLATVAGAQAGPPGEPFYEKKASDPVLKEMRESAKKDAEKREAVTDGIRAEQRAAAKQKKKARRVLRATLPPSELPGAPSSFKRVDHVPPVAQYMTGTCWAFAGTSFLEAETQRITKKQIKLSEMHTVYWEYVERVKRFVAERGSSRVTQGSQNNAVVRMWRLHGAVPSTVYAGTTRADGRHDHEALAREMRAFLALVKKTEQWDEAWVLRVARTILDKHLGAPPASFRYQGRRYDPTSFARDVLRFDPTQYVDFMSTLSEPFFARAAYSAPDNWWKDASYHNVPLDVFTRAIRAAVESGYSVGLGGDVSEPGKSSTQDVAFVPPWDIPAEHIDQSSREYRIANGVTGDDHAIHLVGYKDVGGKRWYLIKDSGRSARHGKHAGYFFFREDFVRLKMLTFTVHRDAVKDVLARMK